MLKKILLVGATGYLGSFILSELLNRGYNTKVITRNTGKLDKKLVENSSLDILKAEVTNPDEIVNCCENVEAVISTVGITNQKDGLTYMDVDYQANKNILAEALKSNVQRFLYVSVFNGKKLKNLKICEAKELFVEELEKSGLNYCVARPNGFFSDITEFYNMAKKGRVYLFGDGKLKSNPIHGADLAKVCVDSIENNTHEFEVGGPEILTQNEIAALAFKTLKKDSRITYIPDWIRKLVLTSVRIFTGTRTYGPVEFFLTVMSMDFVAPEYGKHTIAEYFSKLTK
jgi:uncharacterized protein YbjT (DUF2867 family)